ncbi:Pectate lyase superfamily protein, partial [Pseudoduganella namucuonensis]
MSGMFSTGALAAIKAILAASTGTAGIGYANDGTPVTLEQGLDLLYRGIADVRNEAYAGGAVGDGVADDAPAFQAAFDSGRIVMARDGTYLLASPISVTLNNAVLMGGGRRTVIKSSSATADIFLIGDGVAEISGVDFSNFRVWASVTKTAGYVFNCRKTTDSRFVNIGAGNIDDYVAAGSTHKLWNGYYFDRFSQVVVSGGEIVVENDGIKARGNADQSFGAELSILGGLRIFKAGGKAVHLGGATGGVYLGRMDISECYRGLYCDDTLQAGVYNREVFLSSELTIDMCTGWGINIESNGLATLESPGAWISGCGNSTTSEGGIRVAPTTGVSVSAKWGALRVQSCYYDGMQLNSGAHALAAPFIR